MKKTIVLFLTMLFLSGCAHDTYSMSNLSSCGTDQKPFKATKPVKRKVY